MPWPSVRASTIPRTSPTAGATFSESSRSDPAPFQGSPYGSLRHSTHSPLRIGRVACAESLSAHATRPIRSGECGGCLSEPYVEPGKGAGSLLERAEQAAPAVREVLRLVDVRPL